MCVHKDRVVVGHVSSNLAFITSIDSEALELSEFSDKSDDDEQMYESDDNELGCILVLNLL